MSNRCEQGRLLTGRDQADTLRKFNLRFAFHSPKLPDLGLLAGSICRHGDAFLLGQPRSKLLGLAVRKPLPPGVADDTPVGQRSRASMVVFPRRSARASQEGAIR